MNKTNRFENSFRDKAYIAYLTAGSEGIQNTIEAALALAEGGVNLLEIGVPFSDPIADGPVIQRAAQRALQKGTTLDTVLSMVENIRKYTNIPMILFSYYNPILARMHSSFLQDAKKAGVDGLLVVDCPLEESVELELQCLEQEIALIDVIAPSTTSERLKLIDTRAMSFQSFLYYACRKGTTGIQNALPADFSEKMQSIKSMTRAPVVVGFGIAHRELAEQVLEHADGVVVGSLFVKALEEGVSPDKLKVMAQTIYPERVVKK